MLFDYERGIIVWRIDQITQVQICEIIQHFWKNFEGVCQTRWRRDTGSANEYGFDNDSKVNSDDNKMKLGYSGFEDFAINALDKIGNEKNLSGKLYKGKVIDIVQENVSFDEVEFVDNADIRGKKLNNLFREGIKRRVEHERDIYTFMESFNGNTITFVQQLVTEYYKIWL